ncbi:MAG: 3-dehydroquinate synthase [Bacteroidales bacterium]|nr:3-dehydroquinate synthase [Bacteroidales bacterium]
MIYYHTVAEKKIKQIVCNKQSVIVLCDKNTKKYCLPPLFRLVPELQDAAVISVPAGEKSKDWKYVGQLCEKLLHFQADRNSFLLNLGGGVVCDLGGFVASVFKRGISYAHIPTSLLAQVDAAIGGKTAVNFKNIKNQIGTFYKPQAVFVFPKMLKTLPFRHCKAGLAEMLKHGLIADENHWQELKTIAIRRNELCDIQRIEKSIQIKQSIVNLDFKDTNERKKLNFGHSVGHALEAMCMQKKQPILHGEAVAWGMLAEAHISFQKQYISENELHEISTTISSFFKPIPISLTDLNPIKQYLYNDKKRIGDSLNMTLLQKIGTAVINQNCSDVEFNNAFEYIVREG